jgi:hypothetical protein
LFEGIPFHSVRSLQFPDKVESFWVTSAESLVQIETCRLTREHF